MKIVNKILVIGTSGFSKEVAQIIRQIDPIGIRWAELCYVAEKQNEIGKKMPFGNVSYFDEDIDEVNKITDVVVAIGHPGVRKKVTERLKKNKNIKFPNIVHPSALMDRNYISMGRGNIITAGVKMTCDIEIGDFNVVNLNSTIGHDVVIGSCNVINPGVSISGGVKIGDECLFGTGCCILEGTKIVSVAVIGAGAVVTKNIECSGIYVGVPARKK